MGTLLRRLMMIEDHVCPWWVGYTLDNPIRRFVHNPEKIFAGLVGQGQTVMDLGCGMGYFSLAMARMVGPAGKVIAVDIEPRMLRRLERRASRAGLLSRIVLHRCLPNDLSVEVLVDFALAFWSAHEAPDLAAFLGQARGCLRSGSRFLVVEPKGHVPEERFRALIETARTVGLEPCGRPSAALSRAVLLRATGPTVSKPGEQVRAPFH
jgi:ubiquinone/menaquinone biosynthesis C-methylase UbiE